MASTAIDLRRAQGSAGRVPPHNMAAEESLLGAMLLSRDAIGDAAEIIGAEHFYKPAHGHVFEAILALNQAGEPADPVTVADELARRGLLDEIGGETMLLTLQTAATGTANAAHYARIIEEHALLRGMIRVGTDIVELGYEMPEDVDDALNEAERAVFEVAQRRVTDTTRGLPDLLEVSLDELEKRYQDPNAVTGVPTGFSRLDDLLGGLQPSALLVIGARPAMGKSALALSIAGNVAIAQQKPVLFFSLEMGHNELTQRLLAAQARVESSRIRSGKLDGRDWSRIHQAVGRMQDAPLYIDDNPNVSVMEIRSKARRLAAGTGGLGLVVIDYLQLMQGRSRAENRQVEVAEISRGLKVLARELQVPVIALSQLSRNLEQRTDKRPMLSDLRESGCLTADTCVTRADTGGTLTMGEICERGLRNIPVWTLDDDLRWTVGRMTHAFPTGRRWTYRLRLENGLSVKATANHPFLTVAGWKALGDLSVGDRVATPRDLPTPRSSISWPDDEVMMLAHMIGGRLGDDSPAAPGPAASASASDGEGASGIPLEYRHRDLDNVATVEKAARHFGVIPQRRRDGRVTVVDLTDDPDQTLTGRHRLRAWLGGLAVGIGPHHFLPDEVFAFDERHIAMFVRHLWAAGGTIDRAGDRVRIHVDVPDRRLAHDLMVLLWRLDIATEIVDSPTRGQVRLAVSAVGSQIDFLHRVGTHGRHSSFAKDHLRYLRTMEPVVGHGRPTGPAASDIVWSRIEAIEPLGVEQVYDATVADTHNFVADGIVVHNSIEQDSDVVMFLYRDEVYNPDSSDRGMAELIVAKHRAGATDRIQMAFIDHYTLFADIARNEG